MRTMLSNSTWVDLDAHDKNYNAYKICHAFGHGF